MDIRGEIRDYIFKKELTGAILLTGEWGCGKSYLVKEIAKEINDSKTAAVATISLFGLDSIAAINQRVKEEYLNFMLGTFGKLAKKISKGLTTVAKDGLAVAHTAADGLPGLNAASQGLSAVMNYDVFGYISVKNTVGKKDHERQFVIIFDDLERCDIEPKKLLGAINEYVENKQIKTIIVAEEKKVSKEYKEYKEKLISRTLKMRADYEALIGSIIMNYSETCNGYKQFLQENKALVFQSFSESKTNNLRIVKCILADFERVYDTWDKTGIPTDNLKWALYTFACDTFVEKTQAVSNKKQEKTKVSFLLDERHDQYRNKGKNNSSFGSLYQWISEGIWDEAKFVKELESKQKKKERQYDPVDNFISGYFWNLQQKDIDEGLPKAMERAYAGSLSANELIWLLSRIHSLKEFGITLPCEIDYQKMEAGLDNRIEEIKRGLIEEPRRTTFAERSQLDSDAYSFYIRVESLDNCMLAWKNREAAYAFLRGEGMPPEYLPIESFDNDFLQYFEEQYTKASNGDKRDYGRFLMHWTFDDNQFSSEKDKAITATNFQRLISWIEEQRSDDSITMMINREFAKELKKHKLLQSNS